MSTLATAVEKALRGDTPSAAEVRALWEKSDDVEAWLRRIERELQRVGADRHEGQKTVLTWLRDAARAGLGPDHDATIALEVAHLEYVARDDGGFAEAVALHLRHPRAEIAALAMKGAFTMRDYASAERYARASNDGRGLAGALMHQRRWDEAFALLDELLVERGPRFGGPGVFVSQRSTDRGESAIEEAVTIARWAAADVPEWVRALGGLWEAFKDEPAAQQIERKFITGLHALASVDDFDIVIRQLRERSMLRAATLAARIGAERFANDSWIQSVHGNLARDTGDHAGALASYRRAAELTDAAGMPERASAWMAVGDAAAALQDYAAADSAFARARSLIDNDQDARRYEFFIARSLEKRDPVAATDRALALLETLAADPSMLVESDIGFATAELALGLLLAKGDKKAIDVQNQLIDAKLSLWGECPAVWVERQNLGTVYATLGDADKARSLITKARKRLATKLGEAHPYVALCDRSLARLEKSQ